MQESTGSISAEIFFVSTLGLFYYYYYYYQHCFFCKIDLRLHDSPLPCNFLPLVQARKSQRCLPVQYTATTNMAGEVSERAGSFTLDFRGALTETERGSRFWNSSVVVMKFFIERSCIKSVRKAKNKPNYGMRKMDGLLEEVIGKGIVSKLNRSNCNSFRPMASISTRPYSCKGILQQC